MDWTHNVSHRRLTVRLLLVFSLVGGLVLLAACGSSDHATNSPSASSPPVVIASPRASPTAQLPLTVTASGLTLTLSSVTETKAATRFSFSAQLPKEISGTTSTVPLLIRPSDIQLTAGNDTIGTARVAMTPRSSGTDARFVLTFGPVAQPSRTMILTLARIQINVAIPGTPFTTRVVQGPWKFVVNPQQLANQPLPTPDHLGIYDHLTAKQAARLVDFPVIEPSLPPIFDLLQSDVSAGAYASTGSARANWVILMYPAQTPLEQHGLTITETSNQVLLASVQDGKLQSVSSTGTPTSVTLTSGSNTIVTISGMPVTKIEVVPAVSGTQTIIYRWEKQGIWYQVQTILGPQLAEPVLKQVVASMIAQE